MAAVPQNERTDTLPPTSVSTYTFGEFCLDGGNRLLSRNGEAISIPARSFDTLLLLVQRHGQLVTKTELLDVVWANSFVEESNLTVAISTLRRALGDDPQNRKLIQTVSGRGYRFIGDVTISAVSTDSIGINYRPVEMQGTISPPVETISSDLLESPPVQEPVSGIQEKHVSLIISRPNAHKTTWWLVAVCSLLIVSAVAWRLFHSNSATFKVHSVAILPMSGAGMDDDVLLGMTDTMIERLGRLVVVRPTSSVLKYFNHATDLQAVGKEQNVDAVVMSTLSQRDGNSQIDLKLYRAYDGRLLWNKTYRDTSQNMPRLQDIVDSGLNAEIRKFTDGSVKNGEPLVSPKNPVDNAAYRLYLRGRYFWNRRTEESLHRSIDCFRQSIAADPNYAPAYAGLADSYALLASFSVEPGSTANPDARTAALSAIQLDATLAEPHASLGMIYFFTDWNGPAAETEFERAIVLNPNYPTAHHWYALDLAAMGRFHESLYEIHRAQTLDPMSFIIDTNVGWIEYLNHNYRGAIGEFRKVLDLDPSFVRARTRLGIAEIQTGDYASAIADLTKAQKLSDDPYISGLLGEALAKGGRAGAAEQILRQLKTRSATKYVPPFSFALVYLGLGQKAAALDALEKSVEDRSTSMVYAKIDPELDDLRADPRFQKIVSGMKF